MDKVTIGGDSILKIVSGHDDEGNTVGESPVFIQSGLVEMRCLGEQLGIDTHNANVVCLVTLLNKLHGTFAIDRTTSISNFS